MNDPRPTKPEVTVSYLRAATGNPAYSRQSIERQLGLCLALARELNLSLSRAYIDYGASGMDTDRPGLAGMMHDLSRGGADFVITADLARLARDERLSESLQDQIARTDTTLLTATTPQPARRDICR